MNKKVIKIIILFLIIVLLITLGIILFIIFDKNDDEIEVEKAKTTEISQNKHDNYNKSVYTEKNGVLYTSSGEPSDGINFEYIGIPNEVLEYIKDAKSFFATMKTYAFTYGFCQKANSATYSRHEYQQETNRLAIEFLLNDENKMKFIARINLENQTIQLSY